jgi:hypothetical protein
MGIVHSQIKIKEFLVWQRSSQVWDVVSLGLKIWTNWF